MRRLVLLAALVYAAVLVGCGSSAPSPRAPQPALLRGTHSCVPAPGRGVAGVCIAPKPEYRRSLKRLPRGSLHGYIPDVSEWNGRPDWNAVRASGVDGAIIRIADPASGHLDAQLGYNAREAARVGLWHAFYWFLRPGDCAGEGAAAVRAVGNVFIIADGEVPLNAGCIGAFTSEVHRLTGLPEEVYSSTGTYPGGANPESLEWDAAYGPAPECFLPSCRRNLWQFTDGEIGPGPHFVSGIGNGDVSRNEGITSIAGHHHHVNRRAVEGRIRALRYVIVHDGCARRVRLHIQLGPKCTRWLREGDERNDELGR